MYGMGGGGTTAVTTTTAGVAGVTLLPNTGNFRVMFIIAAATMTIGIVTLLATGVIKLKKSLTSKAE
jgi:hypothetical protein